MTAISVVVPTFNRSSSLNRLLHALDDQDPVPGGFEVIVVDDGSTDDTEQVTAMHDDVHYIRQENAGPATARNRGWRAASAPLIAFTDDDTVPGNRWLLDLSEAVEGEQFDAVGGLIVPLVPGLLADFVQLEQLVAHGTDGNVIDYLATANCAYRRSTLEALGGFDESFPAASGEDTDLTLRARAGGYRLAVIDGAGVSHDNRTSMGALMRTYRKHGRSRRRVVVQNPQAGWGRKRRAMANPCYWVRRYNYYRSSGCSVGRSVLYVGLRGLGLSAYLVGILQSRLGRRSLTR